MKFYFAPLHGVGRQLFRQVHCELFSGYERYYSPFIGTVSALKVNRSHLKDIDPDVFQAPFLIPQVIGNDPVLLVRLIEAIGELGYPEVNWNLGCPFKTVANKQRGSGLLLFPERVDSILEKIFSKIKIRFSIKTRLGRKKKEEFEALIPVFNRYPLSEIIIHPRVGVQMYRGHADLDAFGAYYREIKTPVVYNGDIRTAVDIHTIQKRFPDVNRLMIGRAAVGNPLIVGEFEGRRFDPLEKKKLMIRYHDTLMERYSQVLYGPGHLLDKMKEIWSYLEQSFAGGRSFNHRLQRIKLLEEYRSCVQEFFETCKNS